MSEDVDALVAEARKTAERLNIVLQRLSLMGVKTVSVIGPPQSPSDYGAWRDTTKVMLCLSYEGPEE